MFQEKTLKKGGFFGIIQCNVVIVINSQRHGVISKNAFFSFFLRLGGYK